MEEIKLIPEHKLSEIYDFIHYFRIGLEKSNGNKSNIMQYAGCWQQMSDKVFTEFLNEIHQRRSKTISRRKTGESCID